MEYTGYGFAAASGSVAVTIQHGKTGLWWIVWQLSVASYPARSQASCTVTRNGNYMTSTATVPASAQGPPAWKLEPSDVLTFNFSGFHAGDECIATLLFEETLGGRLGTTFGLV